VSPVATTIWKHACEVADRCNARSGKAWTGVGIGPTVAAVSGPEDKVHVIVREASTAFIHTSNVHVACSKVAGDLHVADKWRSGSKLSRIGPGQTIVSGKTRKQGAPAHIEIVP
jgi:hypothetical protein